MSNKSPIFSIAEPQHFSDHYVFHPQVDYFQILEETRMQKIKEAARYSIDTLHFKLQKIISKDESPKKIKKHNHKKKWWKNALLFFKWNKRNLLTNNNIPNVILQVESEQVRVYAELNPASSGGKQVVSDKRNPLTYGPVYITESRIGSGRPCRKTCRPSSGRLAGKWIPTKKSDLEIPYINLKEFNMDQHHWVSRTSAAPIYLVT